MVRNKRGPFIGHIGTTTSGCVRASVVDAFSLNYRVILAE
jgi:nicotinamidase-related amidase